MIGIERSMGVEEGGKRAGLTDDDGCSGGDFPDLFVFLHDLLDPRRRELGTSGRVGRSDISSWKTVLDEKAGRTLDWMAFLPFIADGACFGLFTMCLSGVKRGSSNEANSFTVKDGLMMSGWEYLGDRDVPLCPLRGGNEPPSTPFVLIYIRSTQTRFTQSLTPTRADSNRRGPRNQKFTRPWAAFAGSGPGFHSIDPFHLRSN